MPTNRVTIQPSVLKWAIENSQVEWPKLLKKFPRLPDWLSGEELPTVSQLEGLSKALYTPLGYFFLHTSPTIDVVESNFRTIGNKLVGRASKNLEDTLIDMEKIYLWMREYRIMEGNEKVRFVNSVSKNSITSLALASFAHKTLCVEAEEIIQSPNKEDAFKILRNAMEKHGVLVNTKGFVGTNTRRPLDVNEFRGFALVDEYAPLIFINGKDTWAGRLFSLVHEFMHILLGVDDIVNVVTRNENYCNEATAEFFAPRNILLPEWSKREDEPIAKTEYFAELFKMSRLAMAFHLKNLDCVDYACVKAIEEKTEKLMTDKRQNQGGNFWNNKNFQLSKTFTKAVVAQTEKGMTSYTEAFDLLDIATMKTYDEFVARLYR